LFDTLTPGQGLCAATFMRSYVLDALSGFALDDGGAVAADATTGELVLTGLPMPPLLIETGSAAGGRNATGGATATTTFAILRPQSGSVTAVGKTRISFAAKRLGWREVANWQELHEAARKK